VQDTTRVTDEGHPAAEAAMRRLLLIPEGVAAPSDAEVERVFSTSLALSATRCIFTYMILPLAVHAIGALAGFGPVIGALLSVLAFVFDVRAIRAFWWADDSRRWVMTALYLVVMVFVVYLFVLDVSHLHL
jgi:hypothetical protein